MRIGDSGLQNTVDPLPTGICFKTPSGCLKPQIVPDPKYTMFFPPRTIAPKGGPLQPPSGGIATRALRGRSQEDTGYKPRNTVRTHLILERPAK